MLNRSILTRIVLLMVLLGASMGLFGHQGVYGAGTAVSITTNDLVVESAAGTTTYRYNEMDFEGGKCFCQRLAFRSAQAFLVAIGSTAVNSDTLTIISRWNTHGAEELFVHEFGWPKERVIYPPDLTDAAYLTLADAVYYFIPAEGDRAWKVQASADLFPDGFFEKRTAVQTATTPEEKQAAQQAFMPLKTQAIANLTNLPLTNAFTVEELDRSDLMFAGWSGQWVSAHTFLDDTAMQSAYEAIASQTTLHTAESVKDVLSEMYYSDFTALDVAGDVISYTLSPTATIACTYTAQGEAPLYWGDVQAGTWHKYQTDTDTCSTFTYLVMTSVHAHEDSPPHWHLRYGSDSFDTLISDPHDALWWPTAMPTDVTAEALSTKTTSEAAFYASMLPPPLAHWTDAGSGQWISTYSFLDNAAMQDAYAAIAQAAGSAYTPADVQQALQTMYQTTFSGMELGDSTITFLPTTAQLSTPVQCAYQSVGKVTATWGDHAFEWHRLLATSAEAACDAYRYLIATDAHSHGESPAHWHMRYGSVSFDAVINSTEYTMWWPTLVGQDTTVQQFADELQAEADDMASMVRAILPEPSGDLRMIYLPLVLH